MRADVTAIYSILFQSWTNNAKENTTLGIAREYWQEGRGSAAFLGREWESVL